MHSLVRDQAGIQFEGGTYNESFILGDVAMDWPIGRDELSIFDVPGGVFLVAPLPHERFRIVASVPIEDAPDKPSMVDLQRVLDDGGPVKNPARILSLDWSSRFRVHHRIAKTFKSGRVLIAGDAAHVHSPAGGQGMNTGIQDAVSLGGTLSEVLRGGNAGKLEEWEKSRRAIARRVMAMTDRLTRAATMRSRVGREIRDAALALVGHLPWAREALAENLAELHNR